MTATPPAPFTLPAPVGAVLARLPAYPGSLLLVTAINLALAKQLPDDVKALLHGKRISIDPHEHAQAYCQPATVLDDGKPGPDFSTPQAVLDGVRDILSERWAEDAALVQKLREWLWADGLLRSSLVAGKNEQEPEVAKFRDYFDYEEPIGRIPSHRALAVFRGRSLEILDAKLVQPQEPVPGQMSLAEGHIALHLGWSHQNRKSDEFKARLRCV